MLNKMQTLLAKDMVEKFLKNPGSDKIVIKLIRSNLSYDSSYVTHFLNVYSCVVFISRYCSRLYQEYVFSFTFKQQTLSITLMFSDNHLTSIIVT